MSTATLWAGGRDTLLVIAEVAPQLEMISVQRERHETARTRRAPTAVFAQGYRGTAAAVMEQQCLVSEGERFGKLVEQGI